MKTRFTDAIPLAPRPNLAQYRTLARDLLGAAHTGDAGAVLAWAAAWIRRLARLQSASAPPAWVGRSHASEPDAARMDREANAVVEDVRRSRLLPADGAPARLQLSEAQLVIARLHGFESWPKFVKHIASRDQPGSAVSDFETAADAIVTGDLATVQRLIDASPRLVHARSTREHRATLLHYTAANGHEGFRQRSPRNAVAIATVLLEAGAAADALASMYDHQCTTMEMLVSSVHPHAVGVQSALVEVLLNHGAAINGVADDGSPLMTSLMFGYPRAAETLVLRGARTDNVISAAAMGRADLVDRFVDDNGRLLPGSPLVDVPWPHLPQDPAVHLGYALTWACRYGRGDVVELLLRKGVDAAGADGDMTALHTAAARGRLDLVRQLIAHGASLETLNRYGGTVLDSTLWFAVHSPVDGIDYPAVVRALIALGARVDAYPEMKAWVDEVLSGMHTRKDAN